MSRFGHSAEMSPGEVGEIQKLLGILGSEGADLLPISGDQILLQNPDEIIERTRLGYPPLLRDAGITGIVRLLLLIAESGRVNFVHLFESSGHRALDDAALEIARQAEFTGQRSGETPI